MSLTYCVTIIDEEGNLFKEIPLTADDVVRMLIAQEHIEISGKPIDVQVEVPTQTRGGKRTRTCGNCRKPGHIARHCPKLNGMKDEGQEETEAISRSQYGDIKTAKGHGMSSREISKEMDLPLKEVNAAYRSSDYENYIFIRQREE